MLETTRLLLRDFQASDFAAVHAYASDPQVTRFTAFGPNSESDTRNFLERASVESHVTPRRTYTLAIIDKRSQTLIGGCGLERADDIGPQYVLGYCLDSAYWNQRFGTEAVRCLLALAFERLDAWRVYAPVFVGNAASARLLTRLGLRLEGTFRQSFFARGAWHDEMIFALLRSEWSRSQIDRDVRAS